MEMQGSKVHRDGMVGHSLSVLMFSMLYRKKSVFY